VRDRLDLKTHSKTCDKNGKQTQQKGARRRAVGVSVCECWGVSVVVGRSCLELSGSEMESEIGQREREG